MLWKPFGEEKNKFIHKILSLEIKRGHPVPSLKLYLVRVCIRSNKSNSIIVTSLQQKLAEIFNLKI